MTTQSPGVLLTVVAAAAWVFFLGLWALITFWDVREQKIRHRHLWRGLAFSAVVYALLFGSSVAGRYGLLSTYYRADFYRDLFAYVAASALAALGMWRGGVWPAGDAKLFVLLATVFPMLQAACSFQGGWLFLYVLINTFIPAAVAVFLMAAHYVWVTRLRGQSLFAWQFARQLGPRRALAAARGALAQRFPEALGRVKQDARAWWNDPLASLRSIGSWAVSMLVMSVSSLLLKNVIASPMARTLVCFAVLLAWGKINSLIARRLPLAALSAAALVALVARRPELCAEVARSFGYMSVFGVFMYLGMKWTMGVVAGNILFWVLPAIGLLGGFLSSARGLLPLAGLGLFFGLSFVLVRLWDDEDHPDIPPEKLISYMVLHHSIVDRLRADPEFFAEHFSTRYADGLTAEQAEALRQWAALHHVESIPLTTTMAFSHWIFFGYFLTWLLGGHVLQRFY